MFRQRRNSARTRSTSVIRENSNMMTSRLQKLGTTKLEMIMIRNRVGMLDQISIKRWPNRSSLPPVALHSTHEDTDDARQDGQHRPNSTEMQNPYNSPARISRPWSSVPSQFSEEGGARAGTSGS